MKLWGKLMFGSGTQVRRSVLEALCELFEPLRATRHSESEGDVAQPITSLADLPGSILWAKDANYLVRSPGGGPVECTCEFKVDPPIVQAFMEQMATLVPTFGYACAWDEYLHRNQVVVKLRVGTLEAMLGKDLSMHVPGLYWLTLLSETLAEKHGVPLTKVETAAIEHVALGRGLRLFRFHEHPDTWRERADEIDALCAALPGVFDVAEARAGLVGITELSDYHRVKRLWA